VLTDAIRNIVRETSLVDLILHVLTTWGKKVVQERIPAVIPTISGFMHSGIKESGTKVQKEVVTSDW